MWVIAAYLAFMVIGGYIVHRSNKKKDATIRLFRNKAETEGCLELFDKFMDIEDPYGQLTPQLCFDMAMMKDSRLADCVQSNLNTYNCLVSKFMETADDNPKKEVIRANMLRVWNLLTVEEKVEANEYTAFLAEQER